MVPGSVTTTETPSTSSIVSSSSVSKWALFLLSPCLAIISAALFSIYLTPKTVSFDMRETVDIFTRQAATQNLNKEQLQTLTRRFNQALHASLDEYQQRHRVLILVTPAVISGAQDITVEIRGEVAERMKVTK